MFLKKEERDLKESVTYFMNTKDARKNGRMKVAEAVSFSWKMQSEDERHRRGTLVQAVVCRGD